MRYFSPNCIACICTLDFHPPSRHPLTTAIYGQRVTPRLTLSAGLLHKLYTESHPLREFGIFADRKYLDVCGAWELWLVWMVLMRRVRHRFGFVGVVLHQSSPTQQTVLGKVFKTLPPAQSEGPRPG